MFQARIALVALLLPLLSGCYVLDDLFAYTQAYDQIESRSATKTVYDGNADRALLVDIGGFYSTISVGEPIVLDLNSGARTPAGVDLSAFNGYVGESGSPVQTDGNYLAWREFTSADQPGMPIDVLDLRNGDRRQVWDAGRFEELAIRSWVLEAGRVCASAYDPLATPAADPQPIVANLIHDLATGQTRRTPPVASLSSSNMVAGSFAFGVRQDVIAEPLGDGVNSIAVPVQSVLIEIDLESATSRTLAEVPAGGTLQRSLATATHVVWHELDWDRGRSVVSFYDRVAGESGTVERGFDATQSIGLEAAGDAGVVVSTTGFSFFKGTISRYEFIDWEGKSVVLQSRTSSQWPVDGGATILGERVIWNDLQDGRLRYYVISTGERRTYDE